MNFRYINALTVLSFFSLNVQAQRDTTKQSINITSSYKPVLRNAVKINFSGSQLPADTNRKVSAYNIPSQNLFYAYEPVALKPLALQQDSSLYLGDRFMVKAGFGNYSTPYLRAMASLGDGRKTLLNLDASYISSKGNIINQDYSMLRIAGNGSYFANNHEFYGGVAIAANDYYLYGYNHGFFNFTKDQIRQQFKDFTFVAGLRNIQPNALRVTYNPSVSGSFFTNADKVSETTVAVNVPAEKLIGEKFLVKAAINADLTSYSTKGLSSGNLNISNNVISINPSVQFAQQRFKIHAGFSPVWDNSTLEWLPDFSVEAQIKEKIFMFQAGWVGKITKNTYRNIVAINPFVERLSGQFNTKEVEFYGGLKGTLGKHFNVNAKASWISYDNFPLFINDPSQTDKGGFVVINEPGINNFRIHADVSYINQDKFTLTGSLNLNGYTGLQVQNKAWNTLPMEMDGSMRWWAFKKLLVKGDLHIFGGGKSLIGGSSLAFDGGSDLSAGAEYKINKQFSVWLDANNLLNNKYERWKNYPVYGMNVLGGIIINL